MARSSDEVLSEAKGRDALDSLPAEDDLGRAIRWGLEDSVSGAEPPDEVWSKIMARVQGMRLPGRHSHARRRPSFSLAPLVQTVVVSALLLAFGLGIDRNLSAPRGEQTVYSTPTAPRVVASEELPNDMLSGYLLARMEQRLPAPQRPGGARP